MPTCLPLLTIQLTKCMFDKTFPVTWKLRHNKRWKSQKLNYLAKPSLSKMQIPFNNFISNQTQNYHLSKFINSLLNIFILSENLSKNIQHDAGKWNCLSFSDLTLQLYWAMLFAETEQIKRNVEELKGRVRINLK